MITIDYSTNIVNVPKSYLTLVSGTLYSLDIDAFRKDLKTLESSEIGITYPPIHKHTVGQTVSGTVLSRVVNINDPYTLEFENGIYAVDLFGANSNIADKTVVNSVSLRSNNSAGLIDSSLIISIVQQILKYDTNRTKINDSTAILTVYDDDGSTPLTVYDLKDRNGVSSTTEIFERIPQ